MSQYVTVAQFFQYIPATIADGTFITGASDTNGNVLNALITASGEADAHMRGRFNLPITGSVAGGPGVFDPAIVMRVCWIAAFNLMRGRGFNPVAIDTEIKTGYAEAIKWFEGVQRQSIHPDVVESTPDAPAHPFPSFTSAQPRGWNCQ